MDEDACMDQSTYIMDGHNDLPWAMRELNGYDLGQADLATGVPQLQTDIPRLRRGGVGAQFWSVFVPCSLVGWCGRHRHPGADRLRPVAGSALSQ